MGHAGPASTGTAKVSVPQCSTNCAIQVACLATNASRVRRPTSISSRACSQIAVIPGSATAAGTALDQGTGRCGGHQGAFFLQQITAINQRLDDTGSRGFGADTGGVPEVFVSGVGR